MSKVSIIIPSRNEEYLSRTVDEVFNKATGEMEVIVILDGTTKHSIPKQRQGLTIIKKQDSKGLRSAIKDASNIAKGKYLLKMDAHSAVSKGFDEVLKKDCEDNWVVVSRYHELDVNTWEQKSTLHEDYFYLGCP